MKLGLIDINAASLASAKSFLSNSVDVETYTIDVSDLSQWATVKSSFESKFGGVDLLVLNAGTMQPHTSTDVDAFHKIFDTNFFGYVNGVATFLPTIKAQSAETAIVLTGSKQGITNPPGNPAYNATKAAVRSYAEQLSYELRGTKTSVHLLVPGWTFTGMTGGGKPIAEKPAGAWLPEQVANYLVQKMGQGSFYIICPDNDVTEEMDKKRMLWTQGDIVEDRPPLSRWREDWKEKAQKGVDAIKLP